MILNDRDLRELDEAKMIFRSNKKQLDYLASKYFLATILKESDSMGDTNEVVSINFLNERIPTGERMTPAFGLSRLYNQVNK